LIRAAREAGFAKSGNIHGLRIEGADEPGLVAKIARALADAGINFRGLSAAALGRKFVSHLALDSPEHAGKAASVLKKLS
jgi:predicted amino acid-binding ACT domain protein